MKTFTEQLKSQVNLYGELHLTKRQATLLLNYLEMQNRQIEETETHFKELVQLLNKAGIVDAKVLERAEG